METVDLLRLKVIGILESARQKYSEASILDEIEVEFEMYSLTEDDPMVQLASGVLSSIGLDPQAGPSGGGTDANIYNRHGIPCVVVGMSTREMHTVREYVPIPDLIDTARFCQALLTGPRR